MKRVVLPLAATAVLAATPARAFERDEQLWAVAYLQAPIAGKLRGYFEAQPRWNGFGREADRLLLRPALYYPIGAGFTAWAGYAWTPTFQPALRHEHRPWQQLMHQADVREVTLINRLRFEQRFIENTDGAALRLRYMARFVHRPRAWSGFGVVVWNELFLNLNSVGRGPSAGIDQNRLAFAVQYAISKAFILEPTYIANAYYRGASRPGRYGHTFLAAVWITF